jgi:hypothetical protein
VAIYFASADNCMHFRDIAKAIKKKLLLRMTYTIFFNHLCRTRNITGLLLEQQRRKKEKEQFIILVRGSSIKYEQGFLMFELTNFHCKVTDIQAKAVNFWMLYGASFILIYANERNNIFTTKTLMMYN